ncbi:hypothetical protein RvY_17768 [Ramazzottius varieornatus]|uniref:Uncharacterized protein n=1 Tax=Ramazzottius varieornatus TaxID=947166 RepID=A0A1D1W3Y8_RAMVA|nr:hypothetical protein RvY_17768 [Ramazzottius varieornatus]
MAEFTYNNVRKIFRFPGDHFIDTIENAAKVRMLLAEQSSEASFVASLVFLQLCNLAAATKASDVKTIEINWSTFAGPYKAFLKLSAKVAEDVANKIPRKPAGNKEAAILRAIYESLQDNSFIKILSENEMVGSCVCERLVSFLRDYWNCLTGIHPTI